MYAVLPIVLVRVFEPWTEVKDPLRLPAGPFVYTQTVNIHHKGDAARDSDKEPSSFMEGASAYVGSFLCSCSRMLQCL